MTDDDCARVLALWCPRLGLRTEGFRRVRRQVRKRLGVRMAELGTGSADAYLARLESDPAERLLLDASCRISISRFFRDRPVFDLLERELPGLARIALDRPDRTVRILCAGAASGEEPYSVALMLPDPVPGGPATEILALEASEILIRRARDGVYPTGSLRELPDRFRTRFVREERTCRLAPDVRARVGFVLGDVRTDLPRGPRDLVLCRNLVFTYHDPPLQARFLEWAADSIVHGGLLVAGRKEAPPPHPAFAEIQAGARIYRRA